MRATAGHVHEESPHSAAFRDGLGERRLVVDPDTREVLEHLDLAPELGAQERAIRERVERLSNFRNVRFPRLHQVVSAKVGQATVVSVVAEHAPGHRLSELLAYVDRHPTLVFDVNTVLQVAREVLPALAVLHDSRGVTHGALGLERLVLSPQGRVGIVDYALGAALTKLQLPRTRLWRDYRIAMPPSAGIPRFDARADVAGVAVALLAMLIGRPLSGGEFPNELRSLLASAAERLPNGTVRPLSASLRTWFERTLPVESRKPFATALDAQLSLEDALKRESAYSPSPGALKSFLQRYESSKPREQGARASRHAAATPASKDHTGTVTSATVTAAAGSASRPAGKRRLSPEEESAEEIRALEAELARIAHAETPVDTTPLAPSPEIAPVLEVELVPELAPALDGERALTEGVTAAAAVPEGHPECCGEALEPTEDLSSIEAEIEVEIVSLGKELPKVDVAALAGDALSIVVDDPDAAPLSDATAAIDVSLAVPAGTDEEIQALEELLRQYSDHTQPASPPDADDLAIEAAGIECEVEVLAAAPTEPDWMLTPPPVGGDAVACDGEEPPRNRDDATLPLDFDAPAVPEYVVRLFDAGWVTGHLVAKPAPVARPDIYRMQVFAAAAPSLPADASRAADTFLERTAHRSSVQATLPAFATPVVATLATRPASTMDAVVQAARQAGTGLDTFRVLDARATKPARRKTVASLPAETTPVAALTITEHPAPDAPALSVEPKRPRATRRRPRPEPSHPVAPAPAVPSTVVPFVRPELAIETVAEPQPMPVAAAAPATPVVDVAQKPAEPVLRVRPLPADPWKVEAEASRTPQVIPFTPRAVELPEPPAAHVAAADASPAEASSQVVPPADPAPRTGDPAPRIADPAPRIADPAPRIADPAPRVADVTPPSAPRVADPAPRATSPIRVVASERRNAADATGPSMSRVSVEEPARGWRINWRRTAAASLVVILLEGVAFATAYWLVKPSEMGTLLVETSQAGVDVLVDGRASGRTPLTAELKPGRHTLELRINGASKVIPVEISPGVQTTQQVKWPAASRLGRLKVTTTPPGARILVDGQYRGASPLVLDDVPAGRHAVVAESPSGTVKAQAEVGENELAEIDLGIFSGWLTVFAPVEVRIFESGRLLGTSLDGKLLVAPGRHEIELVNTRLGYRETRSVDIEPGKHTALSVTGPSGSIVIEAPDGTEVTVDGQSAGATPLDAVKAPIGTREVVLKHPALGQRRMTVTVRADAPARVSLLAPQ